MDGSNIKEMKGPMSYDDICDLLDSYNIKKRNTHWEPHKIRHILTTQKENNPTIKK